MYTPDTRHNNMVSWLNGELKSYIVSLRETLSGDNLALKIATYKFELHLDLIGYPTNSRIGYLREEDLRLFGETCGLVEAQFMPSKLSLGDKSYEQIKDNKVTQITRSFGVNRDLKIWDSAD